MARGNNYQIRKRGHRWPTTLIFKQKIIVKGQGVYEIDYKNVMPGSNPVNFPLVNLQRKINPQRDIERQAREAEAYKK